MLILIKYIVTGILYFIYIRIYSQKGITNGVIVHSSSIKVLAAYIAVCIIWGSTYLAIRIAVVTFPPEIFAGLRFCLAGGLMLAFALVFRHPFPKSLPDAGKSALTGIILLTGCNGLVMWAEQWVHSGITALLLAATPLFTACIEAVVIRKVRLKPVGWLALIGGFAGVALLVVCGKKLGSIDLAGAWLVLLAALFWAIGSVYYKESHPTGSIVVQSGIQMFAAGVVLCGVGVALGEHHRMHWTMPAALSFAYLVVFGSIVAYCCNMYVLSKWNASRAVTTTYINPVVAVLLGAVVLAEPVSLPMIFAMMLTIGSVVAVQMLKGGYRKR